ncbi:hypothetical protein GYMLUDRAFT_96570 [Collybiopsis luxurians FD-317 M1]|uniref:tRNA pseudouridine synthase 1 n=1 Tax=Collybiopsis luxurians FD-317 M1 TaxID=944289 RepID=A0A0D0BDE0_9AGAR|nr:hypothetical protein GYMLUDRAFT_96570 [Collybiopsis luxurians FD-317 M1]
MGEKRVSEAELSADSKRLKPDVEDSSSEPTDATVLKSRDVVDQATEVPSTNDTLSKQPQNSKDKKKPKADRRKRYEKNEDTGPGSREEKSDEPKEPRLPKRECALQVGFCGSNYRGMQYQKVQTGLPEPRTIEGELFRALVAVGAVSKDNAADPVKVSFARAARTDAGVHAVGNVVSLKMIIDVPGVDDLVALINSKLPADIRLWGFQRVQKSFDARRFCDARKYTYFFPSYLLIPPKPGSGLDHVLREYASSQGLEVEWKDDSFWSVIDPAKTSPQEDMVRKRAWRAAPSHVDRLRTIIAKFEKTHNFHNFTVARDPKDKTNERYMKELEVSEPGVFGETEWIAVTLHGQSFMLHQRKMMFALVMICRTGTPTSVLDELMTLTTVNIPKMPALGLLLEHPIFSGYNAKIAKHNGNLQPSNTDYREPIDFNKYSEKMSSFKQEYIYDNMQRIEDRKGLFDAWIRSVDSYSGKDFLYLNPKGVIPAEAVVKKGERREVPFRERKVFNLTSFAEDDNEKVEADVQDDADVDAEENLTKRELQEAEG